MLERPRTAHKSATYTCVCVIVPSCWSRVPISVCFLISYSLHDCDSGSEVFAHICVYRIAENFRWTKISLSSGTFVLQEWNKFSPITVKVAICYTLYVIIDKKFVEQNFHQQDQVAKFFPGENFWHYFSYLIASSVLPVARYLPPHATALTQPE